MKRTWSAHSNDLENDGTGIMGMKAQNMVSLKRSAQQNPKAGAYGDIKNTTKPTDYDYDQEFEEISFSEFTTPPEKKVQKDQKEQHTGSPYSTSFTAASELVRNKGTKDEINHAYNQSSSSSKGVEDGQSSKISIKRQLPDSFRSSGSHDEGFKRTNWSKSASELMSGKEGKLNFFIKGTTSKSTAGTSSLGHEAKRDLAKVFLSREQQTVYDLAVDRGQSLFFTGSAGTGKSVCLREIIKGLRRKYDHKPDAIAVTASTGIAACNIGGITLHAFAGAGLCNEEADKLVSKIRKNRKTSARWMRTNVLVIDEVSMIGPELLEKLEEVARVLRKSAKPFGGMQIIMTGDFFQLPPVDKRNGMTKYAFDAKCWSEIFGEESQVKLTQVFRQKDESFVNMLNELRYGTLSPETVRLFKSLEHESDLQKSTGMAPTILFPTRMEVERANAMELVKIKRPHKTYDSIDGGTLPPDILQKNLANFMAPSKLNLKIGCQVMLIKNTDLELSNGTIGTVLAFCSTQEFQESQFSGFDWDLVDPIKMTEEEIRAKIHSTYVEVRNEERELERMDQYELDEGEEKPTSKNVKKEKDPAAALARAELDRAIRRAESRERSRSASPDRPEPPRFPVVRFILAGGSSYKRFRTAHVTRETWTNEQPNGEITCSRSQVPLILSWAMSIHKSQGQTLPIVKIDLNKTFEKGQAYVALSRAVSKEGLQVLGFDPRKVRVDQRVVQFYKALATINK